MTPCSSPVRDVSGQDDSPDSTTIPDNQHQQQQQEQQQPEKHDEPRRVDRPADQLSVHGQVARAAAELQGLSLDIDTFTKGKGEVVEAVGGDDDEDRIMNAGPGLPVPYPDDSEGASQTSSEESWASFPSSGSNSTDSSSSDAEEEEEEEEERSAPGASADAPMPSPAAAFKFHEEFYGCGDDSVEDTGAPLSPIEEEFTMGEDGVGEEDLPYPIDTGPWTSRAIPRWAFLRSSNSLPTLGLGPEDFYHGGSALRHEVSPEEVEGEEEERKGPPDGDGESSKGSRVVYL